LFRSVIAPESPGPKFGKENLGNVVRFLVVLLAYVGATEAGLAIPFPQGTVAPLWPAAAIGLAALLLFGKRFWPAIFLADLALRFSHRGLLGPATGTAIANTVEALIATEIIRTIGGPDNSLRRLRDVLAVFVGALAGCTAGATLWSISRAIFFALPIHSLVESGLMWIRSDVASILVLTPLILAWGKRFPRSVSSKRAVEAFLVVLALASADVLVFGAPASGGINEYAVEHFALPFAIWLALRFNARGATFGTALTALIAIWFTLQGRGAFAREGLVGLQIFFAIVATTALIIEATVCEYRDAENARLEKQEQLAASEERYRDLFENAEDFIITMDLQGRFTSANKAVLRAGGYTLEEFLKLRFIDVVVPGSGDMALLAFGELLAYEKQPQHIAYEMRCKDGRRLWVEVNSRRIFDRERIVGVQSIGRDVSWRRRLEQELLQAQKMEAMGLLAGGVAHDFNNLLGVIIGYSDLVLNEYKGHQHLQGRVEEIRKAGRRAAEITQQLLAFSRKQVLQPRVVELNPIVRDTSRMLMRLLGEDIQLEVRLGPVSPNVTVDPTQMQQLILNLAINARDAMPRGGKLVLETSLVRSDEHSPTLIANPFLDLNRSIPAGNYALLKISDTGSGMEKETLDRIFEPFFTTKPPGQGTGLGLSTVFGFVNQSGGYISVDSRVGIGTTFYIYLPPAAQIAHEVTSEVLANSPQGNETILLVEDELSLQQLNVLVIQALGYQVLSASSPEEALNIVEKHNGPINLLLTDVVMPGMSGKDLAERIVRARPRTKVLYMSGYTDSVIVRHGILREGVRFLEKPFAGDVLACKIREALDEPTGNKGVE
jgi:PAS domain S-box-containing protein